MVNDYRQIISQLRNSCWYIVPESLETILEIVNMRLNGVAFSDEEIRLRLQEVENGDRDVSRVEVGGGVGILPLYGPIFPKANLMTQLSGSTSLEQFSADLDSLLNNDDVENIILDIDSPGGVDSMIPETAQKIREARDTKPIHAVANTMAGSAAYYLASQASSFYASPSGKVGSIGAYIVHEDYSAADEKAGRKITFISSGKFKTAGNEHEPLSLDAKDYIQTLVNESHEQFVQDVAEGRGVSADSVREYADGRIFSAKKATDMGMIDGVKSLNDLAGDLLVQGQPQVMGTLSAIAAKHQKALEVANKAGITLTNISIVPKEGRMNEQELKELSELSSQLREVLELDEGADVIAAVTELKQEITPIREVQAEASKQAAFAQQFPEEYQRMQALEDRSRTEDAKSFASQYERFSRQDGDKQVKSSVGFPMVTLNKIEECHQAISNRAFSHAMLENLLNLVSDQGFVDFSEKGSSRQSEAQLNSDPIQRFADRITSLMVDDSIANPREATKLAIVKWPDEYEEYREAQARKSNTTA